MHKHLGGQLILEGREPWDYYFNTRLVTRSRETEFEEFMVTDGLSASLVVSRPKTATEETVVKSDRQLSKELLEGANRVVALDPGRNPIFTAVVHDQCATDSLQSHNPHNVKHEVITWTKRRFYQEAGYVRRGKMTKLWTSRAPHVQQFNQEVATPKTGYLDAYTEHTRHVLTNLDVSGQYRA